jgi:hypothetical protein
VLVDPVRGEVVRFSLNDAPAPDRADSTPSPGMQASLGRSAD